MRFEGISFPNGIAYLASSKCFPKSDYETKETIIDRNGNSLWQVPIAVPSERELESFMVTVSAKKNPVEGLEVMAPLKLENLTLSVGVMNGNKKYFAFRADSVKGA